MTKNITNALKRRRFAGSLGAAALFSFAVVVGCGNDDIPEPNTGGKSGAGGAIAAAGAAAHAGAEEEGGAAGSNGEAGAGNVGGGPIVGGGSGGANGGSTAGGASGNGGGGGPTTAVCGNGKVEGDEQCDDGNKNFGDSCSPTCTNICEKCEKDVCGVGAETNSTYQQCFGEGGWEAGKEIATAGPAAGKMKSELCRGVVACLKRTKCGGSDPVHKFALGCYCGTKDAAACQAGDADGPCHDEIASAAESRNLTDIAPRAVKTSFAIGVALAVLDVCDVHVCGRECIEGKAKSTCDQCAIGDSASPCDTAPCYYGGDDAGNGLCGPAIDCALRTGCAASGVASCYGEGTGPCAAEIAAAAGTSDPSTIKNVLGNPSGGPLGLAVTALSCEVDNCKAACFPGGAGGGGADSGGAGGSTTGGGGTGG